jgi:phosphatidylglycerophosphate synthase
LRFRELGSAAGLLSLARAPLAVAFPLVIEKPLAGLAILAAAAVTDVLDGWWARHSGGATATGAILDPVMDKLFVAVVVLTLMSTGRLSAWAALLVGARDIVQLPLAIWFVSDRAAVADRSGRVRANVLGKLVTVLQFGTVACALLSAPYVATFARACGVVGMIAGASYWFRLFERRSIAALE